MSRPATYLAREFAEPLPTTDGGTLRTVGDAVAYMTALPDRRGHPANSAWHGVAV